MKWLRCAVLLGLMLSVSGALAADQDKKADPTAAITSSDWYPLAVGNEWNYTGAMKFTMRVAKHEKVGDVMCARLEMIVDNQVKSFEHLGVTSDGIYRYTHSGRKTEPPVRILKLPPKAGETWDVNTKVGADMIKGAFKLSEEEAKVPAGSYKAMVVTADDLDANGTRISFKSYYAKDVGMVKQDLEVSGQKALIELEKFTSAKK
jgi:hypothetical protein